VLVDGKVSKLGRFSDPALFILVSLAGGEKHEGDSQRSRPLRIEHFSISARIKKLEC
jgi:hypothetical protein